MNYIQRMLFAVSDVTTKALGNMIRVGAIHEVKGNKMRMVMGKDHEGQDVLSPWLNTANQRGGARERRFYKKGQNMMMISPGGDPAQAVLLPAAPSKNFLSPDHANKSGQDEETYQLEDLRIKQTKEGYDVWLQPPKKQQQQGGQGGQQGGGDMEKLPEQQDDSSGQAEMKVRMNKNGGVTGRVGKMRFMAHKEGAKIKAEQMYVVVTKKDIIMSKPPIIGKDPIPDDDK